MIPYEIINNQKDVIKDLKDKLPYSNDKNNDVKRINKLIDCVNSFESMLISKYYTSSLETLILSLMYEWILQFVNSDKKDIKNFMWFMTQNINNDIRAGVKIKRYDIIDLLITKDLSNIKFKTAGEYFNEKEKANLFYNTKLNELINHFKQNIKWN